jgi:hypothetical protein
MCMLTISNRLPNRVGIFDCLAKTLKTSLQRFGKGVDNFWQLGKICLQRVNICTCTRLGIDVSHGEKPE